MPVSFRRIAPVLPVRSVASALAHYRKLGFEADAYGENADGQAVYGFLKRGSRRDERRSLDFYFLPREGVESALAAAGLRVAMWMEREAYAEEHPSRRAYVLARRV